MKILHHGKGNAIHNSQYGNIKLPSNVPSIDLEIDHLPKKLKNINIPSYTQAKKIKKNQKDALDKWKSKL